MWSLVLAAAAVAASAPVPARPAVTGGPGPRVEVAFVLDTTGSMGGLIEGAKRRIWTIARRIGEGSPRPELRVALVGYRDLGDAYVTRVHDFSPDMDQVFGQLTAFQAQAGGDGPEHVSAALAAAVDQLHWSPGGRTLRLIFLVGDAPPHVDYQDGFDYRRHVRAARARGIDVIALQCGADQATEQVWREVATLGGGDYVQLDAQGGMDARVTPQDAELARLNVELAGTVVAAGSAAERDVVSRKLEARSAMAPAVAAEAAPYFATRGRLAEKDLVDLAPAEQRAALQKTAAADLPEALRGQDAEAALRVLAGQKAKRSRLQARVVELQKQRDAFLAQQAGPKDAFDAQVVGLVTRRAARVGLSY